MRVPGRRLFLRRAGAVLIAAAATAAAWFFLLHGDDAGTGSATPPRGVSGRSLERARELTPAEQTDQVMLIGFAGTGVASIRSQLRDHQLGGVLIGTDNWPGAATGAELTRRVRTAGSAGGRIPPLLAVIQEGGEYRALGDLPPQQSQLQIGDAGSIAGAERWARAAGNALRRAGVDLDLAPIADVATLDSPIADRSFSDDVDVAASMTAAAVRGCNEARIACAVGHFPGLGAASQDTDEGPATVSLDPASLLARDGAAFRAAFAEQVPAVVLSLGLYAAYDAVTPAALARPIATGLLRDRLHFKGLAITDDLGAGAVKATETVPAAAVEAITAGADMVRIDSPGDQLGVRDALLRAVHTGALPKERLASAAARVLELKRSLGLLR